MPVVWWCRAYSHRVIGRKRGAVTYVDKVERFKSHACQEDDTLTRCGVTVPPEDIDCEVTRAESGTVTCSHCLRLLERDQQA